MMEVEKIKESISQLKEVVDQLRIDVSALQDKAFGKPEEDVPHIPLDQPKKEENILDVKPGPTTKVDLKPGSTTTTDTSFGVKNDGTG